MNLSIVLVVLLVVLLIGSVPAYSYNRNWGYAPSGGLFTLLLLFVVLMYVGVIPKHF
jgi:hypothetical protein